MAIELFGGETGGFVGIACVFSYLVSGHSGIYHAQTIGHRKHVHGPAISSRGTPHEARESAPPASRNDQALADAPNRKGGHITPCAAPPPAARRPAAEG